MDNARIALDCTRPSDESRSRPRVNASGTQKYWRGEPDTGFASICGFAGCFFAVVMALRYPTHGVTARGAQPASSAWPRSRPLLSWRDGRASVVSRVLHGSHNLVPMNAAPHGYGTVARILHWIV